MNDIEDRPARPLWRRPVTVAAILLIILLALFLLRRGHKPDDQPVVGPPQVGIATAKRQDVPETVSVIGTVQPVVSAAVRAQLAGTIFSIDVREGQAVQKGQRLAQIDPRPYRIAIEQASGALARDMAQLQSARFDLARYERLLAENSIARQQVDSQRATVHQLEGTITSDRASVDNARLNLRYTALVAPVSGRVGLRRADIGAYVGPNDANGIFVVTVDDPIDVSFAVPQDRIGLLSAAGNVPVVARDQSTGQTLAQGRLLALDNQADATTGTVTAKARFANSDHRLFPNQFVTVTATVGTLRNAVTVPVSAIRHSDQGDFLFVMTADRVAHMRKVKTASTSGAWIAVISGLRAGETVISNGADNLDDNIKVSPQTDMDARH